MTVEHIHQGQQTLTHGTPLAEADVAVILIHGRGASAESMAELAAFFPVEGIAYLMPQAAGHTWYPNSGFGPFEANEPYFSSAMATVSDLVQQARDAGIPDEKIVLGGFSQGACLITEYAARNARRYGGLLIFSGALMGPQDTPRDYDGSFDGTPVFIGGVNNDPWVSEAQLRETANVLQGLGAEVTLDIVPGANHSIRQAEVGQAAQLIAGV